MNKKIYQVFVSSTYIDLKDERAAVEQVLISSDCLPVGMERFPSSNLEQFEYIKNVLKYVDYYILIIGGRYGTVNEKTGLSYTEMEYDYAIENDIPVLVFLKDSSVININAIDIENQDRLDKFIEKATKERLRGNTFKDINELKVFVMQSIMSEKGLSPRPGWIRADFGDPLELMTENNRLRKKVEELEMSLKSKTDLLDFEGVVEINIDVGYLYYRPMATTVRNEYNLFTNLSFNIRLMDIVIEIINDYLGNGNLNKKDINNVLIRLFKEISPTKVKELEQLVERKFYKENPRGNSSLAGLMNDQYKGLYLELNNMSMSFIIRILLENKIFDTENDKFKLTEMGLEFNNEFRRKLNNE